MTQARQIFLSHQTRGNRQLKTGGWPCSMSSMARISILLLSHCLGQYSLLNGPSFVSSGQHAGSSPWKEERGRGRQAAFLKERGLDGARVFTGTEPHDCTVTSLGGGIVHWVAICPADTWEPRSVNTRGGKGIRGVLTFLGLTCLSPLLFGGQRYLYMKTVLPCMVSCSFKGICLVFPLD